MRERLARAFYEALTDSEVGWFDLPKEIQGDYGDGVDALLAALREHWPKPSENPGYEAAFKVMHGRKSDGFEFDGKLWAALKAAHEALLDKAAK